MNTDNTMMQRKELDTNSGFITITQWLIMKYPGHNAKLYDRDNSNVYTKKTISSG